MTVAGWTGFGSSAGLAFGALVWLLFLAARRKGVGEALRGEVEDALGALQGFTTLGFLIGTGVGAIFGLAKVMRRQNPDGEK
jgi:hypothetical protein